MDTYVFSLRSFCAKKRGIAFSFSCRQIQCPIPMGHWFVANRLEKLEAQFEK